MNMRQLLTAYWYYEDEHQGFILPGYQTNRAAKGQDGTALQSPVTNRYPWHLAQYLGWEWKLSFPNGDIPADYLERSIYPHYGLNSYFLGGDERIPGFQSNPPPNTNLFYARRFEEVTDPSRQIVFGNSISNPNNGQSFDPTQGLGFHRIEPPTFRKSSWNLTNPKNARDLGYLAQRWNDKTNIGFLDGHTQSKKLTELNDITLWAPQARSSTYVVPDGP